MRKSFFASNFLLAIMISAAAVSLSAAGVLRAGDGLRAIFNDISDAPASHDAAVLPLRTVELGVYDPDEQFSRSDGLSLDAYFLNWAEYSKQILENQLSNARGRGRVPLIVIEPYVRTNQSSNLLGDVIEGLYDDLIGDICVDLADYGGQAILSWGPWMDERAYAAPWVTVNAERYVDAYRRVVGICRILAPNAAFLWSPWGNVNLLDYWPDKRFVDYVGVPILVDPVLDRTDQGDIRPFEELFSAKYRLLERLDCPMFVTQLGVPGNSEEQARWLDAAKSSAGSFPLLKYLVYFNAVGDRTVGVPRWNERPIDWRVSNWTLLPNGRIR